MVGTNSADKVLGATDPTSGTASVHEVVKGLGALVKSGWKPLRTILIASWDAEEVSAVHRPLCSTLTSVRAVRSYWQH